MLIVVAMGTVGGNDDAGRSTLFRTLLKDLSASSLHCLFSILARSLDKIELPFRAVHSKFVQW